MGNTPATLRTFTLFRTPAGCIRCRFQLFESFLLAKDYAHNHPEMMQEEIEAENIGQAQAIAAYIVDEQAKSFSGEFHRREYDYAELRALIQGY